MSRDFNGTTQYGQITSFTAVTDQPFTLTGWFYVDSLPGANEAIASLSSASTADYFETRLRTDGLLRITTSAGAVTANAAVTGYWQHFAVVASAANSRRIVLNGSWANSGVDTDSFTPSTINIFTAGMLDTNGSEFNFFDGLLAHIALWNVALSQSEVEGLAGTFDGSWHQSGSGDNPLVVQNSNLVAYWPLAGTASPEPDDQASYDLTLTGSPTQGGSDPTVDAPPGGSIPVIVHHLRQQGVM